MAATLTAIVPRPIRRRAALYVMITPNDDVERPGSSCRARPPAGLRSAPQERVTPGRGSHAVASPYEG
jgi:hypothetical protein